MAEVPGAQRSVLAGGPEPRDPLDCWACAVLVTAQNLLVAVFNLLLLALVLGTILLPAVTMLGFGFLCHSQVSMGPKGYACVVMVMGYLSYNFPTWDVSLRGRV